MNKRRALVCGSSKGICAETAIELSKLGVSVTLLARNEENTLEVFSKLNCTNTQKHSYIIADFDNHTNLKNKINKFVKENPPIHILINNSGGPKPGPIIDADTEDFFSAFNRHLICNHILVQALVPNMKKENFGRIINITSTSVKQPIEGLGISNTVRGAVANWAKTLSLELGAYGITVNNILPGFTNTNRLKSLILKKSEIQGRKKEEIEKEMKDKVPANRFGEANEIANAVAFLCSPLASYINGINLPVDGGRTSSL